MTIATILRQELRNKGITTIREAAQYCGVSCELLRTTLNRGHLPKDKVLCRIADALGLDRSMLVLAAHQQKLPPEVKGYILEPARAKDMPGGGKRKWPLSQEQCEYLSRIMKAEEIQLIRKFRQIDPMQKIQVLGYINYQFETARVDAKDPEPVFAELVEARV